MIKITPNTWKRRVFCASRTPGETEEGCGERYFIFLDDLTITNTHATFTCPTCGKTNVLAAPGYNPYHVPSMDQREVA